jgi:hypothetical protein
VASGRGELIMEEQNAMTGFEACPSSDFRQAPRQALKTARLSHWCRLGAARMTRPAFLGHPPDRADLPRRGGFPATLTTNPLPLDTAQTVQRHDARAVLGP